MNTLLLITTALLPFWESDYRERIINNMDNPFRLSIPITPIERFERELALDGYYPSGIPAPWFSAGREWNGFWHKFGRTTQSEPFQNEYHK